MSEQSIPMRAEPGIVPPMIYRQLALAMADVGAIAKSRKNLQQGYSFRGIDDVYNHVQPAFVAHGIVCVPEVLEKKFDERTTKAGGVMLHVILTVRFRYFAADGSFVEAVTLGEAMDSGDKACNKAMSAAQKYAHFQVLSIATEEAADTENETHEIAPRKPASIPPRKPSAPSGAPAPATAHVVAATPAGGPSNGSAGVPPEAAPLNDKQREAVEAFRADYAAATTMQQVRTISAEVVKEPDSVKAALRKDRDAAKARLAASNGAAHP